jgi:hypothetical protein
MNSITYANDAWNWDHFPYRFVDLWLVGFCLGFKNSPEPFLHLQREISPRKFSQEKNLTWDFYRCALFRMRNFLCATFCLMLNWERWVVKKVFFIREGQGIILCSLWRVFFSKIIGLLVTPFENLHWKSIYQLVEFSTPHKWFTSILCCTCLITNKVILAWSTFSTLGLPYILSECPGLCDFPI